MMHWYAYKIDFKGTLNEDLDHSKAHESNALQFRPL